MLNAARAGLRAAKRLQGSSPHQVVWRSGPVSLRSYLPDEPSEGATPLLLVTPIINRFRVVDLQPGASLVDVKVFDLGVPILPAVLGGMQAVLRHKKFGLDIDVVNMSYANCLSSDGTDVFSALANLMVKAGMVVTA